mmetsp:Transcript_9011/g.22573  ORF Transcript_9011/g.22573 Transcript_9011/m.22573 type:complete len:213 (-) Transcript_9011:115-753(-)
MVINSCTTFSGPPSHASWKLPLRRRSSSAETGTSVTLRASAGAIASRRCRRRASAGPNSRISCSRMPRLPGPPTFRNCWRVLRSASNAAVYRSFKSRAMAKPSMTVMSGVTTWNNGPSRPRRSSLSSCSSCCTSRNMCSSRVASIECSTSICTWLSGCHFRHSSIALSRLILVLASPRASSPLATSSNSSIARARRGVKRGLELCNILAVLR